MNFAMNDADYSGRSAEMYFVHIEIVRFQLFTCDIRVQSPGASVSFR